MSKVYGPRHGSLQFWPRKKSKKMTAGVKSWPRSKNTTLQAFSGYKVGMTHIVIKDTRPTSMTKNEELFLPVTILECPALKVLSIRFYKPDPYGKKVALEILNPKLDKSLERRLSLPKKYNFEQRLKEAQDRISEFSEVHLLVYTQPKKTGFGKKTPEILEFGIGGNDIKSKLDYAKGLFDKEIKVSEIIKSGARVDVHSVTTGKGFQSVVKRFGMPLRSHKSEKKRRASVLGPELPGKVHWGVPMPGRMGFNLRTEYNTDIIMVDDKPEKINPKGGFLHYGLIKADYVLVKGSIPGPCKRLVTLTEPLRPGKSFGNNFTIQYISQESKQ